MVHIDQASPEALQAALQDAELAYSQLGSQGLSLDLRHTGRALRATPLAGLVAVLSLTLGIGFTTAVTSLVNGIWFAKMGTSHARYDGERLVIYSSDHEPGYIRTSRGVPQSTETTAVEELWLDGEVLKLRQTYIDESLFEKPFVIDYEFVRLDETELPLYECTDADYDWFEKLNAPEEQQK